MNERKKPVLTVFIITPVGLQISSNISDVMVVVLKSTISPKKDSQQFNSALLPLILNPHHEIWDNWPTFPLFFLLPAARTQLQLCKGGGGGIHARFNKFFCIEKLTQVRQHATFAAKKFHSLTLQRCMQLPWRLKKGETVGCEEKESGGAPAVIQLRQSAIAAFYTGGSSTEIGPFN